MIEYLKNIFNLFVEYLENQKSKRLSKKLSKEDPFIYK
jgi:hypothetical protein